MSKTDRDLNPTLVRLKADSVAAAQEALRQSQVDGILQVLTPGQEKTYVLRIKPMRQPEDHAPVPNAPGRLA